MPAKILIILAKIAIILTRGTYFQECLLTAKYGIVSTFHHFKARLQLQNVHKAPTIIKKKEDGTFNSC
ncbi:hypothetical protein RIR_jg33130.t1 [Rhizophagus irregularis DAOM 181602=DAOM 197198]|nr:hypothetical protein RIR_jg33130.t1 [Rhizophagus irregularis DAOM 181602=DAOM 197198]